MISPGERNRFWVFLAVAVVLSAAPVTVMFFDTGLGGPAEALISLVLLAMIPVWAWWGIAWVRRAPSATAPQIESPTFLVPDRYLPLLKIGMMVVLGFIGLVLRPGLDERVGERLLMFVLLWVPIAIVFGLASSRFSSYMRQFWFTPRK